MVTFLRDTSKDILSVLTLYTLTSTVEVGTHLYDAEGNDTGLTVGTVNQDGSFILAEEPTPEPIIYYAWYNIKAAGIIEDGVYYTLSDSPTSGATLYVKNVTSTGYTIEDSNATVYSCTPNDSLIDTTFAYVFTRDQSKDLAQS